MSRKYQWGERSVLLLEKAAQRGLRLDVDGTIILPSGRKPVLHKPCKEGYRLVNIGVDNERAVVSAARVVCFLTYGPPPTFSHVADHMDGNKLNDHPSNLRWATRSENAWNTNGKAANPNPERFVPYSDLKSQRDELLEVLKFVMSAHGEQLEWAFQQAHDAIAKMEKS